MDTPPLDAALVEHLAQRYPNFRIFSIVAIWDAAWYWVEQHAQPHHLRQGMIPHSLYAAALFRLQYILTDTDPQAKQAFAFAANEALLPYR